jgi:hypothetical protein
MPYQDDPCLITVHLIFLLFYNRRALPMENHAIKKGKEQKKKKCDSGVSACLLVNLKERNVYLTVGGDLLTIGYFDNLGYFDNFDNKLLNKYQFFFIDMFFFLFVD